MALPDFLIAGVPKAGTTALHAALVRHPDLFLSRVKEPKFFLSDGRPPATGGPGDVQTYQEHVWRQADYEALFDAAPPGTLRGEATPFYLYDLAAHDRIKSLLPDVEADPAAARPGGPGALQLDPPVERRPRAGGRLPRRLPRRAGARSRPAGPTSGTTSASAGTAARCSTCSRCSRASRCCCCATASSRTRRPPPWTGSASSSACRTGVLTAIPQGEREPARRRGQRGQPGAARAAAGRRRVRAPVPGTAAAGRPRPAADRAAPQDRRTGRSPRRPSGPRCCRCSPTTSRCCRRSPASGTTTGSPSTDTPAPLNPHFAHR